MVPGRSGIEADSGARGTIPFDVVDEVYRTADGHPLSARIYRPREAGPFPTVIEVHGGAWTSGDVTNNQAIAEWLAARGVAVVSLDFRLAPAWKYPAAVIDVNAGIRWCRENIARFGGAAEWLGILGTSSGGQQALLNLVAPDEFRPAAGDAADPFRLAFAVLCWPISDPLARFRMAQERGRQNLVDAHVAFFDTSEIMEEGSPLLRLERGIATELPPLLIIQGGADENVTPDMAERLLNAYRLPGGKAELVRYPQEPHQFITADFAKEASQDAMTRMLSFIWMHTSSRWSADIQGMSGRDSTAGGASRKGP